MELWTRNTRAYAKRQWTWFRADARILWQRPGEEDALERRAVVSEAVTASRMDSKNGADGSCLNRRGLIRQRRTI